MMLWLVFIALTLAVTALLAWPLWQIKNQGQQGRIELNKAVYDDRLRELEAERQQKIISDNEFDALHQELKLTFAEDFKLNQGDASDKSVADPSESEPTDNSSYIHTKLYGLGLILLPLVAVVIYAFYFDLSAFNRWQQLIQIHHQINLTETADESLLADITNQEALLLMRTQLHWEPQDYQRWYLYGKTLYQMGAIPQALQALQRVERIQPDDADTLLLSAQALMQLGTEQSLYNAEVKLQRLLKANAVHQGAQLILGYVYYNAAKYQQAMDIWQALIEQRSAAGDAEGEGVTLLKQQIAKAKVKLEQTQNPEDPTQDNSHGIALTVDLAVALKQSIAPRHTVFVVAYGDDGSPAPVAVKRYKVADLPLNITLTDKDAMLPGRLISQMKTIKLSARVSFSGTAKPQSGDYISNTLQMDPKQDMGQMTLVIDNQLP